MWCLHFEQDKSTRTGWGARTPTDRMPIAFQDITDLLMSVRVWVLVLFPPTHARHSKKCAPLKQDHLFSLQLLRKSSQKPLDLAQVRDHRVYNPRPRLIQCLVPNAARKSRELQLPTPRLNEPHPLLVDPIPMLILHQIHLVHQAENMRPGTILRQRAHHQTVGVEIALHLAALDVENVDQHFGVREHVFPLRVEVAVHEGVLPAAVPQVERQVAHEFGVRVFHVDGGAQAADVARDEVAEDYAAHAGFAGAGFAHEEDFFLARFAACGGHVGMC